MAFHDDVDDANDANDKTSSEHEFELPFPKPATGNSSGSDSAPDTTTDGLVDLSEASTGGVYDLDAALNADASVPVAPPVDSDTPPVLPLGASGFAPIDLNEEFQRSDVADALDQGMPPWAKAPAPDPMQAVSQLDAPSDSDGEQPEASSTASLDEDDDPYQIPADYTTPDFFASRISRRRTPEEMEAQAAAVDAENDSLAAALAAGEAAAAGEPAPIEPSLAEPEAAEPEPTGLVPVEPAPIEPAPAAAESITPAASDFDHDLGAFDLGATDAENDPEEFSFESLFATEEPEPRAPQPSVDDSPLGDAPWPEVSPVAGDNPDPISAESDAPANHIWKLGPLEPNVQGSAPAAAPVEPHAAAETPLPGEDAIDAAPVWNLGGATVWNLESEDAPAAATDEPIIDSDGFLSLDDVLAPATTDSDAESGHADADSGASAPFAAAVDEVAAAEEVMSESASADADAVPNFGLSTDSAVDALTVASAPTGEEADVVDAPEVASTPPAESVAVFDLDAAFQEPAAAPGAAAEPATSELLAPPTSDSEIEPEYVAAPDLPAESGSTNEPASALESEPVWPVDVVEPPVPVEVDAPAPPLEASDAVGEEPLDEFFTAQANESVFDSPAQPFSVEQMTNGSAEPAESVETTDAESPFIHRQSFIAPPEDLPVHNRAAVIEEIPDPAAPVDVVFGAVEPTIVPEAASPAEAGTAPEMPYAQEIPAAAEPAEPAEASPAPVAPFVSSFAPEASFTPLAESAPVEDEVPETPAAPDAPADDESVVGETAAEGEVPTPPIRRSMADEDILNWADSPENQSTGTLSVIEVLEAQLRLREEEAREYREWETTFRSRGGPVADQVIEQVRSEFADVVERDEVPAAADVTPAPVEHQAESADEAVAQPESETPGTASETPDALFVAPEDSTPASDPAAAAAQLPAWDVPPPSESWSPPADFEDEIPFAAHADPTGSITLPVAGDVTEQPSAPAAPDAESFAAPAVESEAHAAPVAPEAHVVPEASAAAEEPAAPEAAAEPAPEPASSEFDADSGFISLGDVPEAPETASVAPSVPEAPGVPESFAATTAFDIQSAPEFPADEDGDYDEVEFAPPALVEPDFAPSVPRANLAEHVSFGDFGFAPPPAEATSDHTSVDSAAPAPEMAAPEDDAPFAFDLQADAPNAPETSLAAAAAAEAPDHDFSETSAAISEPVVESSPDDAATEVAAEAAPADGAAAFSFASSETPKYVAPDPISFDDLLKTDDIVDADVDSDADGADVDPLQALLANAAPPLQGDPLSEVQTGSMPVAQAAFEAAVEDSESDEAVDDSDRLSYPTELSTAALGADVSTAPAEAAVVDSNDNDDSKDDVIPFAAGATGAAIVGGAAVAGASLASQPAPTGAPAPLAAPVAFETSAATASAAAPVDSMPQPVAHSTAVVAQQPLGLDEVAPTAQRVFSLEESGLEPTPVDRRIGHAARLFWLWFAANSSIVSLGLGAAVFAVGMSLRQSIVAILAGVALSFIPLGLTTLAGKRSGQPTMVVSRSTFGLLGNIAPSAVALVARLFWGAVLLWVLASSVAIVLIGSDLNGGLGDRQLLLIALALSFLIALVIAFAGYPLFARIQLILSIISGVLIVGLIGFTAQYIDVSQALTTPDGSWLLTVTGAVLVFSFLGLVWAYSGADIARYQRPSSSGPASMLSATFGAALPASVLIAYGALLAASDPAIARGFLASPLDTLLLLLPSWYPIPLLLAAALSLLSGITLSLYSGGFALQAIGVRVPRQWSIVIVAVVLGALGILFAFGIDGGINELFRDVATTLAVPTAAWAGIFASETMIRTRKLDSAGLLARGGVYADVRWVNLGAYIVISVIGFALTSATISWLSWQGYGFTALGIDLSSDLAGTDLGVLVALGLGILTPLVAGIPAIRRQEAEQPERAPRPA